MTLRSVLGVGWVARHPVGVSAPLGFTWEFADGNGHHSRRDGHS